MKRILLTLIGTVAGIVSLLSFKTTSPQTSTGALPSAALPSTPSPSALSNPAASGSPAAPSKTRAATTSSYLGSAVTTRYGVVQVKVSVKAGRLTNVAFQQLTAFDGHSQEINDAAAPQLLSETLSAQSAHIDTVSGATYTSDGYVQSLQSALDRAGIK